jgi:hypothetical protein
MEIINGTKIDHSLSNFDECGPLVIKANSLVQYTKEGWKEIKNYSMENKYYTPDISEFYVGFECETTGSYPTLPVTWKKHIVVKETIGLVMSWHPKYGPQFRVKYLDKEDIESLGWENIKSKYNTRLTFRKLSEWAIKHPKEEYDMWDYIYLYYDPKDQELIIDNGESYEDLCTNFDGTIKNKSELKILLKQLGI